MDQNLGFASVCPPSGHADDVTYTWTHAIMAEQADTVIQVVVSAIMLSFSGVPVLAKEVAHVSLHSLTTGTPGGSPSGSTSQMAA